MFAVITGDIVQLLQKALVTWLKALKEILNQFGSNPKDWEVYRGDSF